MSNVEVLDARPDARGGYKVEVGRGERIGRVSSEWFNRPDDERYLSLPELMASVKGRTDRSRTRIVESAAVRVEASRDDAERLDLVLPGSDAALAQPQVRVRLPARLRDRLGAAGWAWALDRLLQCCKAPLGARRQDP